jgi:hypothetical protein
MAKFCDVVAFVKVGCTLRKNRLHNYRLVPGVSPRRSAFAPGSVHVGFVTEIVALEQVFSKLFGYPCQYHSTIALHTHVLPVVEQ